MSDNNHMQPPPDLQSILATLRQFTDPPPPSTGHISVNVGVMKFTPINANWHSHNNVHSPPHQNANTKPQTRSAPTPQPATIDPASITTWQDGLRCVTKIAAQNAQFATAIREMMDRQRRAEMSWYTERQSLKKLQASRVESTEKALSILQSLNPSFTSQPTPASREATNSAEMAEFNERIYAKHADLETQMESQLKGLGVPFFGTDPGLIVPDGYDREKEQLPAGHPKWSPLVTEKEILGLRRRMVKHLEDLYRD